MPQQTRGALVDRCPRCGASLRLRTVEKNAHLHALLGEISKQKQWHGQWLDIETWKRLLVAAYEREKGRSAELYPAVDGHGMEVVYRRTSHMSQEEIRDVILYVEAWAIGEGVVLKEPEPQ